MKKKLIPFLFALFLLTGMQVHAQQADSAAIIKSQERIESNLKDANKIQSKIDKKQRRIEKQQRRIDRQAKKKEKRMKRIEKDQKKINKASDQ